MVERKNINIFAPCLGYKHNKTFSNLSPRYHGQSKENEKVKFKRFRVHNKVHQLKLPHQGIRTHRGWQEDKHTRRSERYLEAHRCRTFQQVHQASIEGWSGRLPLRLETWTCSYSLC